jgi:anthranilate/para-aminobenzoate synthase component I
VSGRVIARSLDEIPWPTSPTACFSPSAHPFARPGWVLALGYDFARGQIEPTAPAHEPLARAECLRIDSPVPFAPRNADGPIRAETLAPFALGPVRSGVGRHAFARAVGRVIDYIRAGDVYQVNLAHPLRAAFTGDPRAAFIALAQRARPAFGAYLELSDRTVLSLSPEAFLTYDPATRLVTTRPMKGTRALGPGAEASLAGSDKDRAELAMITDLMRNDLGRVCAFGSMRVTEPRTIEHHAGVVQTVSQVQGRLRDGLTARDLLKAVFPGGSVTGAPKVRAMQIIRELEPFPRGLYCGSIGYLSDDGSLTLSIAIRTATISHNTLEYPVGAGIVADSDPDEEWRETLAKAWPLLGAATLEDQP